MHKQKTVTKLPENAYRELKPGEEYIPIIPPAYKSSEITPWSVIWGLVMAVIFSAAAAYSGLKIGQVIEAAIPISIIAAGISTAFKRKNALAENVIIQSIGGSSGVIVAGAIFTIPALYILNLEVSFWYIFFSSLLGGFLGILFLIPFRKYFVKDMHGKFPFPEATAINEILITGEKGGSSSGVLIFSALAGGLYDFMFSSLKLWGEVFTSRVLPYGEALADKAKIVFQMNMSSMIFGFGYLIGLKFAVIIAVGSMLSWFVLVPLINQIGALAAGADGINFFASMSPELIFKNYVRHIGIGAIAMAGVIGIAKSSGVIGSAFKLAAAGLFGKKEENPVEEPRTQRDIKMTFIITLSLLTIIGIFLFLYVGFNLTLFQVIVSLLTVVIISFLFTTVAANAIAIVGSNPVSGMTLMTLILASVIFVNIGLTGEDGMVAALIIGGIVCTALSMAGGFITDLKVGYWIGTTPKKQEGWKFLGTLVSAATVGVVIFILNEAYGFTETALTPDPMVAPQANAMAAIIQPLMTSAADMPWMLYIGGAILALLLNFIGIPPLAFALGMYLPLHLNTPLLVGGAVAYFINKSSKDKLLVKARHSKATLITSGFIAGAAIFGVIGAIIKYADIDIELGAIIPGAFGEQYVALAVFALLVIFTAVSAMKAKVEEE